MVRLFVWLKASPQLHYYQVRGGSKYATTKSVVRFPLYQNIPVPLVKKLVKASVRIMKEKIPVTGRFWAID
ncbi:MAG: hypothetical protein AUF79_15965 [Crenarchaeota archaeon 13_1_20CM_2_51_8]|nr:MAG: hypothetical protein AUF79_15965 [Crenarchaeota archaeon 13_1_20CM_2_51_8]